MSDEEQKDRIEFDRMPGQTHLKSQRQSRWI